MINSRISKKKPIPIKKERTLRAQTTTRSMGRRERRAEHTRVKLFRCALRLIARRGISNVTVEEITEAADVGKGTFFNYFQSKEHVLGVMAEIQLGKIREAAALAQRKDASLEAVLRRMVLRLTEEPGRNPRMARALLSSFLASRDVRAEVLKHMKEGRRIIAGLVAMGQKRGEIDRAMKTELVAVQLFQSFMGTVLLWSIEERSALRTRAAKTFEQFWKSVAAPAKGKKR